MKRCLSVFYLSVLFIFLYSCNQEGFDLNKLSTSDIAPKIYAPIAYGTFNVKDYLPGNLGADDQMINITVINLTPITWYKGNMSLPSNALDSTAMEVTLTNSSPMNAQFEFSFTDFYSGIAYGKTYSGTVNSAISNNTGTFQPVTTKFIFLLDSSDLEIIKTTDGLKCVVTLLQPGTPVKVKSVKDSEFKIQLNFRSRIYLDKLN